MFRRLILSGLLIAGLGAPALAQSERSSSALPSRTATARLGLERAWNTFVPLAAGHDNVIRLNVDDLILFVQTSGGNLHAYDAESGKYLWGTNLGPAKATAFSVSVNSDQVFVTTLGDLSALDKATGRLIWETKLEALPSTGTAADDSVAMVGLRSGKLVAYNARDRTREEPGGRSAGSFAWAWQSQAELSSRPISTPKLVAFGSQDGRVYVATKGEATVKARLLYRYLTGGPITANLAIWGNRTLIVPSHDNNIYAIDLFSGKTRWSVPTGAPVDQEPLVSGADVFAVNEKGRLLAIDGNNGKVRWDRETGADRVLALSPSRVYLETEDRELIIVARDDGQLLADARATHERAGLNLREFNLSYPNHEDDRLYFCTPRGLLVCLREAGQTRPALLRDPSLPPFGTIPPDGFENDLDEVAAPGTPTVTPAEAELAVPPPTEGEMELEPDQDDEEEEEAPF